jgi:hypothetical protein
VRVDPPDSSPEQTAALHERQNLVVIRGPGGGENTKILKQLLAVVNCPARKLTEDERVREDEVVFEQ